MYHLLTVSNKPYCNSTDAQNHEKNQEEASSILGRKTERIGGSFIIIWCYSFIIISKFKNGMIFLGKFTDKRKSSQYDGDDEINRSIPTTTTTTAPTITTPATNWNRFVNNKNTSRSSYKKKRPESRLLGTTTRLSSPNNNPRKGLLKGK